MGRFLEHSRICVFANAGNPVCYIGSGDLMHRNLDRRVEALVRITAPDHVEKLCRLIEASMSPETASWHLGPDGDWTRHAHAEDGTRLTDLQDSIIRARSRRRR